MQRIVQQRNVTTNDLNELEKKVCRGVESCKKTSDAELILATKITGLMNE